MTEPRPYSEIKAERFANDPKHRRRALVMSEITRLECEAQATPDPAERRRIQCEAEELRCALHFQMWGSYDD